jgi:hypothetical protein
LIIHRLPPWLWLGFGDGICIEGDDISPLPIDIEGDGICIEGDDISPLPIDIEGEGIA